MIKSNYFLVSALCIAVVAACCGNEKSLVIYDLIEDIKILENNEEGIKKIKAAYNLISREMLRENLKDGKTLLMKSAESRYCLDIMSFIVEKLDQDCINKQDALGKSALWYAVEAGNFKGVKLLVEFGANLDKAVLILSEKYTMPPYSIDYINSNFLLKNIEILEKQELSEKKEDCIKLAYSFFKRSLSLKNQFLWKRFKKKLENDLDLGECLKDLKNSPYFLDLLSENYKKKMHQDYNLIDIDIITRN